MNKNFSSCLVRTDGCKKSSLGRRRGEEKLTKCDTFNTIFFLYFQVIGLDGGKQWLF